MIPLKLSKMIEKHYVYKVSVMSLADTQKPYNSLVKTTFLKGMICIAQTLIKRVVYEGFRGPLRKMTPKKHGKALGLKGFCVALLQYPTKSRSL